MAEYQLRDYVIRPGEMDEWLAEWRSRVVPLRREHGFHVAGAWTVGDDRFVWILTYDGPRSWREAEANYEAAERRAIDPDPTRHVAESRTSRMTPVDAV